MSCYNLSKIKGWYCVVFCESFFVICVCLCHTVMSVSCSLAVTCWERVDLLAFLYVMFSCVFSTF